MVSKALRILRRSGVATAVVCVGLIGASPTVTNAAVGRTPGAASVTATGSAQYTIPLWVPPGTAGMQPTLALTYDHRASNTLLGIGWNIAGLSEIHRCARTRAQDGQPRNVRNDAQDRFCLDGQRLRLVSGTGTYGSDGAEYRTESDTFVRVRSFGIAGNGPSYFTVQQRDGRVYEYGNTTDSRIESVSQGTARSWALNKISDPRNNAILFSYGEDTVNGGYRINAIQYTSNPGQGLAAAYAVNFTYENKPAGELDSEYVAGSEVRQISRMTRIDVTSSGTLVRRYQLAYEPALSASKRSRLASVQECAGVSVDCLPATTFTYQNSTAGLAAQATSPATIPSGVFPYAIDVNGDGRDDLVYSSSVTPGTGSWMVMLANTSGGFQTPAAVPSTTNQNYAGAIPIDYNSDGKIDLLAVKDAATWYVMLGTSTGLAAPQSTGTPATPIGSGNNAAASDVDGDGREDLVWMELGTASGGACICYRLRDPGGTFSTVQYLVGPLGAGWAFNSSLTQPYGYQSRRRLPDFNGDGRGDFAYASSFTWVDPESQQTFVDENWDILFAGGGGVPTMPKSPTWQFPKFLDLNGDGKDDYLYLDGNTWSAVLGTGSGFTTAYSLGSPAQYTTNQTLVLDWDSDGSQDFLVRYTPTGTWHLFRFNGGGVTVTDTQIAVGTGWVSSAVGDFNGDDLDDVGYLSGTSWVFRPHSGLYPDLLLTATDGFGVNATFNYSPLTSANYTPHTDAAFPAQDYRRPMYVVNSAVRSNGIGGTYTESFAYYGGRLNLEGRGFQGFYARRSHDSRNTVYSYHYFVRDFPQTGMLFQRDAKQSNDTTLITRVVNTPTTMTLDNTANNQRYFPHISASTVTNYELGGTKNGQLISTVATSYTFDTSGNATTIAVTATDNDVDSPFWNQQWTSTIVKTILPQTGCLGLPTQIAVTNTAPSVSTLTRTTAFTPNYTQCRMSQSVTEPLSSTYKVTHDLGYDTFGNLNSEAITGIGMTPRTTTLNWGTNGQFPISITNAAGEVTATEYDPSLGVQTKQTAPNTIVTNWGYDVFGRRTSEVRPDGTSTTWSFANCAPSCVNGNNRTILTETAKKTDTSVLTDRIAYLDQFDRPLVVNERLLSGYSRVETQYDALGRVSQRSVPCLASSCTNYWATFTYDALNRVTLQQRPKSATDATLQSTSFAYLGRATVITDAEGKIATKVTKVAGMLGRSKDHDGYYQTFNYDAFGSLVGVSDSLTNSLFSATYDYGQGAYQRTTTDTDLGSRSYTYNALGEITNSSDGKSQSFSFTYDALSRVKTRVEPEHTTTYAYGNLASDHIGRLDKVSMPGYSEEYTYDNKGRLTKRRIASDATYDYDYTYDSTSGLLRTMSYPASIGPDPPLKLEYSYQNGLLQQVKDSNSTTIFWLANSMNQRGQVTQQTLGNGVVTNRTFDAVTGWVNSMQSGVGSGAALQNESYLFDRVGNVIQRQNGNAGLTENFYYDNLYRLDYSTLGTVGPVTNLDLAYDPMGNITSRSDVAGGAAWTYHATKKHAVVQAGNSSFTYSYDANGNAQARNGYTIDWTSYNYPSVIRGPNKTMTFSYGTDRQRFKQIYTNGSTTETTMYVGALLEKVTMGSVVDWRHYVNVGGQAVAVVSRKNDGVATTNTTRYVLEDHQGSVSQILASNGTAYVSESFTAFGARRDASTWSGPCPCPDLAKIKDTTRRGYTEHEAIGGVSMGLNHMNGRVQDAITGRFLSPDPFVARPGLTQGFNRYAYVLNNPLRYTDPSGFTHEVINTCDYCWGQGIWDLGPSSSPFDGGFGFGGDDAGGGGTGASDQAVPGAVPGGTPTGESAKASIDSKVDWCAAADALAEEDAAAPMNSDDDMLSAADSQLTILAGAATAAANSTKGDAFVGMTSAADDASALASRGIPSMAEEFGPLARGLGYVGLGLNAAQIAIGAQRDGARGAGFAAIDAGVTNFSVRLGWAGIGYALLYNLQGGSRGIHQAQSYLGRIERMNSLGALCAASRSK